MSIPQTVPATRLFAAVTHRLPGPQITSARPPAPAMLPCASAAIACCRWETTRGGRPYRVVRRVTRADASRQESGRFDRSCSEACVTAVRTPRAPRAPRTLERDATDLRAADRKQHVRARDVRRGERRGHRVRRRDDNARHARRARGRDRHDDRARQRVAPARRVATRDLGCTNGASADATAAAAAAAAVPLSRAFRESGDSIFPLHPGRRDERRSRTRHGLGAARSPSFAARRTETA